MDKRQKMRLRAMADYIRKGSLRRLGKYAREYGLTLPDDEAILAAAIYKEVQYTQDLPEDLKEIARDRLIEMRVNPYDTSDPRHEEYEQKISEM